MEFAYHRLPSQRPGFIRNTRGCEKPMRPDYRPTNDLLFSLFLSRYKEAGDVTKTGELLGGEKAPSKAPYTVIPLEEQPQNGGATDAQEQEALPPLQEMTPWQRQRAMLRSIKKYCDKESANRIGIMEGMLTRLEKIRSAMAEDGRGKGEGMAQSWQGMMEIAQQLGAPGGTEQMQRMMNMLRMIQAINGRAAQQAGGDGEAGQGTAARGPDMSLVSSLFSSMNGGGGMGMLGSLFSLMNAGNAAQKGPMGMDGGIAGGNPMGAMMGLLNMMRGGAGGAFPMNNMMGMLMNMMGRR